MEITRRSPLTKKLNTLNLSITPEQYEMWRSGDQMIQNAMSKLSADEREFIISGTLPGEWEVLFGK